MIDEATTVPLVWIITVIVLLGGTIITLFVWWLRTEFARLDGQHADLKSNISGVHKRVDWLIFKLLPGHPYEEDDHG